MAGVGEVLCGMFVMVACIGVRMPVLIVSHG